MLFSAFGAVSVHTRIHPLDLAADTILEPSCILNEPAVLVLEGAHKLGFSCEENLRNKLRIPAINLNQQILVSEELEQTSRVMVKDEDVCLHCGLWLRDVLQELGTCKISSIKKRRHIHNENKICQ